MHSILLDAKEKEQDCFFSRQFKLYDDPIIVVIQIIVLFFENKNSYFQKQSNT